MSLSACYRNPFTVCVAVWLYAGCGGWQTPTIEPGTVRADRTRSWMEPGARKIKRLLYVGSGYSVYVYNYDSGAEVGALTGFDNTYGECVDAKGDVFLTTFIGYAGAVLEYGHGGTDPIKTFATSGHPIGCSVDAAGDLAVNNGTTSESDLEVWAAASRIPKTYENQKDCNEMWAPGYDNRGNLFMEVGPNLCELPVSGDSLIPVTLNHSIIFPGSVMWDGRHLTLTDQGNGEIYRVKETRKGLMVVGTTQLEQHCGEVQVVQPFIVGSKNTPVNDEQGTVLVGGNEFCSQLSDLTVPVAYWHYPRGGDPFKFAHPRPSGASGQVVSIAQ